VETAAELAIRLVEIGRLSDLDAMALPEPTSDEQAGAIRRAVVVFALWAARAPRGQPSGDGRLGDAAAALALAPPEHEALRLYDASSGRFSFFDRRAANWLFGHVVAMIVGHPGDFAFVAPAAAWAIHAIKAAEEAVTA
jgi:hypothetical protein